MENTLYILLNIILIFNLWLSFKLSLDLKMLGGEGGGSN